jgi:hypothetical protein
MKSKNPSGRRENRPENRGPSKVRRLIEAARSPFERRCLLKWSYRTFELADRKRRRHERAVVCRYCGNWHIVVDRRHQ